MRSEHRDKHAARRFLRRLVDVAQRKPERVTTDPQPPYRRAIRWILGRKVRHRCSQYLHTLAEQSHRAIKQRDDPMLGSGVSRPPRASARRSMSSGTTSALASDAANLSPWPSSDGSSSHAGGH